MERLKECIYHGDEPHLGHSNRGTIWVVSGSVLIFRVDICFFVPGPIETRPNLALNHD